MPTGRRQQKRSISLAETAWLVVWWRHYWLNYYTIKRRSKQMAWPHSGDTTIWRTSREDWCQYLRRRRSENTPFGKFENWYTTQCPNNGAYSTKLVSFFTYWKKKFHFKVWRLFFYAHYKPYLTPAEKLTTGKKRPSVLKFSNMPWTGWPLILKEILGTLRSKQQLTTSSGFKRCWLVELTGWAIQPGDRIMVIWRLI